MVKNDKAARSNEACVCTMEILKTYQPANIVIEWGEFFFVFFFVVAESRVKKRTSRRCCST